MRRRGFALMDAIMGGVILGIGLAVILSVASRSLTMQSKGRNELVASWLLDEMLSMVIVEGPVLYPQIHPTHGRFDPPFEAFEYDLNIEDVGLQRPFEVTATVRWAQGRRDLTVQAQTYITQPMGDPLRERAPIEPIDRNSRYYDDET